MGSLTSKHRLPTWAIVVLILLVSAGIAAAVTIVAINPNPISPGTGTLSGSNDLALDSQSLTYSGTNVTGVDVAINNTGSVHTADVHIALKDSTGAVIATQTVSGANLPSATVTTVSVTFASEHSVDSFAELEVTVEQTG